MRQGLLISLLLVGLTSCVPGAEDPFAGLLGGEAEQPVTEQLTGGEVSDLTPTTETSTGTSTETLLVVEIVETPIDQLEQNLIGAQEESETGETVLTVVTLDQEPEENQEPEETETTAATQAIETQATATQATETQATETQATGTSNTTETSATSTSSQSENTETNIETSPETAQATNSVANFSTTPIVQQPQGLAPGDPEIIIIEYTNVDSIQEDASLDNFFAAGPHALLAMRDESEMIGIATLAPDGTLSLRTADVLEHSRPADETFVGCLDVTRDFTAGAGVFGGISFFESISTPGLILTPVLDINGDGSYIPPVNYVRLTDPLLVSGTCFEIETAVESVQASFVPGWNRLLREIDWRDVVSGNAAERDSDVQKTLWSVNNNAETIVKWLYSRP